jgi:hypothetical protein
MARLERSQGRSFWQESWKSATATRQLPQRSEERSDVLDEQFWFLHRREVPAPWHHRVALKIVGPLGLLAGRAALEQGECGRHGDPLSRI